MRYSLLMLLLVFCAAVQCEDVLPQREAVPRLAVFPLFSEKDPDYGVFMADRLVDELMRHRDIPAYQGRWFELVEPDTIPRRRMKWMVETKQALKDYDLFLLKTAARADWALIGFVSDAGTRTLHVRLVDLDTGEPVWTGQARSGRAPGVMSVAVQQVKDALYGQLYTRPPEGVLVGTVFPVRSSRAMFADSFDLMARRGSGISHTLGDGYMPVTSAEDNSLVTWESWVYVTIGGGWRLHLRMRWGRDISIMGRVQSS